ncbi:MAG: trypsin-like serine protease, partial [Polyangiales bacterium]
MFTRLPSTLLRISLVGFTGSLLACTVAQGGIDDSEVENSKPTASPIIGASKASAYPEAAIVDMYRGGVLQAACSGSVIAPQVVLTAGHCVDGFDGWRIRAPYTSSGVQTAQSSGGITYDWKEGGSETVNPNHHDVGLIFLETAITLATYPTLATAPVANGSKVYNLGRINNGVMSNTDMFIGAAVSVSDAKSSGFPYDYISTDIIQSGDSGGPDILAGTHQIVAVNSGAGGSTQVLARVDLLSSWIQSNIASHGGSGGGGTTPPPPP